MVDEAHHLFDRRTARPTRNLGATIASLGKPQVLALTATAGDEAFARIVDELRIEAWVIDPTVRENLNVVDARGTQRQSRPILRELFAAGEERHRLLQLAQRGDEGRARPAQGARQHGDVLSCRHADAPNVTRSSGSFAKACLRVIVATSAFGEGIDLPDVRHVVLYHLNFDFTEFNQQAGRAGRDGDAAHDPPALRRRATAASTTFSSTSTRRRCRRCATIYRGMRGIARDGIVRGGNADIAGTLDLDKVRDRTIGAAVRIFDDSSLVEIGEDDEGRYVRFLPVDGKVDMERNERFAEGEATRESFKQFCELALRPVPVRWNDHQPADLPEPCRASTLSGAPPRWYCRFSPRRRTACSSCSARRICATIPDKLRFPAAALDPEDEGDLERAALRELYEEVGIEASRVTILGRLPTVSPRVNLFDVTPFVAIIAPGELRIDPVGDGRVLHRSASDDSERCVARRQRFDLRLLSRDAAARLRRPPHLGHDRPNSPRLYRRLERSERRPTRARRKRAGTLTVASRPESMR